VGEHLAPFETPRLDSSRRMSIEPDRTSSRTTTPENQGYKYRQIVRPPLKNKIVIMGVEADFDRRGQISIGASKAPPLGELALPPAQP